MADQPSSADVRQFLFDFFSDEELSTLCFDFFPEVHDDFTAGMTKQQKIRMLLEYCQHREIVPNLLAAIQRARPEPYEKRFPQAPRAESRPEPAQPVHDPKQVFISHAHEDAEFAHRLAGDMQQRGWRVWIAPDSIRPGEKWVEAINRGLAESGVFILVLTPAAVKSRWVTSETNVAIGLEHQGRLLFVPLEAEQCDAPPLWDAYQRVSFSGGYEDGLVKLVIELEQGQRERRTREAERPAKLAVERAEAERLERERREREELVRAAREAERKARQEAVQRQAKQETNTIIVGAGGQAKHIVTKYLAVWPVWLIKMGALPSRVVVSVVVLLFVLIGAGDESGTMWLIFMIIFGAIGAARGLLRELRVMFMLVIMLFGLTRLDANIYRILVTVFNQPLQVGLFSNPTIWFIFYLVLIMGVLAISYQGRISQYPSSDPKRLRSILLALVVGLGNGYLAIGTIEYYIDKYKTPLITIGLLQGEYGPLAQRLLRSLPPDILNSYLTFLVILLGIVVIPLVIKRTVK